MTAEVHVYSKENCQQCTATYRWLDANHISFITKDATTEDSIAFVKSLGYTQAPVTIVYDEDGNMIEHWYGFNVEKLAWLKQALADAELVV